MNDAEKSKLEQELKKAAPVINRLGDGPSVLPDHVRARLNTALDKKFPLAAQQASEASGEASVRKTVVEREKTEPSWLEVWRWWIGLATATAAVVLIVVLNRPGPNLPPVIQVAMLDSVGTVRGTGEQPMDTLRKQWKDAKPQEFSETSKLKQWQADWSAATKEAVAKVVYDRDAGVLTVMVKPTGKAATTKVFPAKDEQALPQLLVEVQEFISSQLRK